MKQVVQYLNNGELKLEEVPQPGLRSGSVLVANYFSLVSTGTEKMTIDTAKKSLVGKAMERPDMVKKVLQKMKTEGIGSTLEKVKNKLDTPIPLGYSCAGVVIAVAENVDDFQVGDRVACAGQGVASHAEVVCVPKNLCVKIPDGVIFEDAAYVTLGAIAMQGVRVAEITLGECVMVIGLGLLGQITVQLLKSAGCRVLGIDIDPNKAELAKCLGADAIAVRGRDNVEDIAADLSRGRGIDAAIITAATSSNDPVELAAEVLRDKGRVVIVGAVKMDLPRKPYYEKELDLRLSRSYGPGRYDPIYELDGVDYPIGYVRWTERRNMESFLDVLAEGKLKTAPLTTHRFSIEDAMTAYDLVQGKIQEPFIGILLQYPSQSELRQSRVTLNEAVHKTTDVVGIGVIGAGSFAQSMLLPKLAKLKNAELRAVASRNGVEAKRIAERFCASYACSSADDILADQSIDAVIISTRHDTHVPFALEALRSGKHVFLEKPLAINHDQLDQIIAARAEVSTEVVVDFNRRYSPLTVKVKEAFSSRTRPLVMCYRLNAGFIPKDHWIQDLEQGGGRIIGEVCHFVDLLQHICGSKPIEVYAVSASGNDEERVNKDNLLVTLKFADGSVGMVVYVADGDPRMPKERLEVLGQGSSVVIEDFRRATFLCNGKSESQKLKSQDKGHAATLERFVGMVRGKNDNPVPFDEAVATTRVTFAILESLGLGVSVPVA